MRALSLYGFIVFVLVAVAGLGMAARCLIDPLSYFTGMNAMAGVDFAALARDPESTKGLLFVGRWFGTSLIGTNGITLVVALTAHRVPPWRPLGPLRALVLARDVRRARHPLRAGDAGVLRAVLHVHALDPRAAHQPSRSDLDASSDRQLKRAGSAPTRLAGGWSRCSHQAPVCHRARSGLVEPGL